MKKCLLVCWFGKFSNFFPIWIKSCLKNEDFDFIVFNDQKDKEECYGNVRFIPLSKAEFCARASRVLDLNVNLSFSYKICDFRPAFGLIFNEIIKEYDFWGYCDTDLVFGKLNSFITDEVLNDVEAVFNGGHFSLFKNNDKINNLFKQKGALFSYKKVFTSNKKFAFDETTGIYKIAEKNFIRFIYGITFVDADCRFSQIRSRLDSVNPEHQVYYWENGVLFRVKEESNNIFYQKLAYIHLQKRKMNINNETIGNTNSFWIDSHIIKPKKYDGFPSIEDVKKCNVFPGETVLHKELKKYKISKIIQYLKSGPAQLFIRIRQSFSGINFRDGKCKEVLWVKF